MPLNRMPHDEFMKWMLSDLRVAKGFFTAHLPKEVVQNIDLDSLVMQPTTYIDKRLLKRESDVLYRAHLLNGETVYVYLLVEHQSTSDPLMAFRLNYYMMQILDGHIRQAQSQHEQTLPLPLIYPIVFYNGREKFSANRDIFSLFGPQESQARDIFLKLFQLVDISTIEDEAMREHQWAALLEWCMRHSSERDFIPYLSNLGSFLRDLGVKSGDILLIGMLNYIASSMDTEQQSEKIIEILYEELPQELEGEVMTLAEQLFQKGRTEGRQEGKLEGKLEGELEGTAKTLLAIELFEQGLSVEAVAHQTGLSIELLRNIQKKVVH